MPDDDGNAVGFGVLQKGEQRFIITYVPDRIWDAFEEIQKWVDNPLLDFTDSDGTYLRQAIKRQNAERSGDDRDN